MSNLQILSNSIRTFENLYSLNDLHQASGSENKHAPFRFIRLETTKELIAEIESDGQTQAVKVYRGSQGGTYVCEELVLSYAMWISPKFHLIVLDRITCVLSNAQNGIAKRQPNPTACRRTPKPTGASLSFSLPGKRLTHQSATNLYRYRYRPPLW